MPGRQPRMAPVLWRGRSTRSLRSLQVIVEEREQLRKLDRLGQIASETILERGVDLFRQRVGRDGEI